MRQLLADKLSSERNLHARSAHHLASAEDRERQVGCQEGQRGRELKCKVPCPSDHRSLRNDTFVVRPLALQQVLQLRVLLNEAQGTATSAEGRCQEAQEQLQVERQRAAAAMQVSSLPEEERVSTSGAPI